MNISTSECSSESESGWTMYLDQFSSSTYQCNGSMPLEQYDYLRKGEFVNQDEEDEDLSMLSDASSGPPHLHQDEEISENIRYIAAISTAVESKSGKHNKKGKEHRSAQSMNFHLDDTASSPVLNFSKSNAVIENNKSITYHHHSAFSTTRLKGKPVLGKNFGFFEPSKARQAD